ncbi:MAG: hypothetical protein NUW01_01210 [Gemmatimonadaceae bacterium]|nr:hypothetical protein [Gemmatimonadaceae bacterium]
MYRALKVIVSCGAVLVAGCGDSSRIPAELQKDLALASADADLQLASRATDQTSIVGLVERITPPARAVAKSTRAPRPRRSPAPQITADVQPETEIVEQPEVAAVEEPMPSPELVVEAPVEIAASTRPRAAEPAVGGSGTGSRGTDWGTIIGIAGTVVLRGGDVGEDRCIPPGAGRGRTPIAINDRFPPRTRGTGRVTMGDRSGRMGGTRPVVRSAPARPRDVATRPTSSPSSRIRPMPSGGTSGTSSNVREGRTAANGDLQ